MGGFRKFKCGEWEFKTLWFISFWPCLIATILALVALSGISGNWFSLKYDDGAGTVYKFDIGNRKTCVKITVSNVGNVTKICDVNKTIIGKSNASAGNTALAMCIFATLLGICWSLGAILVTIGIGPKRLWQITLIGTCITIVIMAIGWIVFIAVIKGKGVNIGLQNKKPDIESRFGVAVASSVFFGIAAALMGWGRILDVESAVMKGETPYGAG